ncbi:unnamed protein product [Nyctereutes procyonoides]|uniref:(raccoon dog) hypothetical protein n=1 Tax=Nyctereutes procyonoides TaxID=34880 RepID=A0A811Y0I5_NYCPR|nr:unnamed protein product [Nyctereutes procyonoides]
MQWPFFPVVSTLVATDSLMPSELPQQFHLSDAFSSIYVVSSSGVELLPWVGALKAATAVTAGKERPCPERTPTTRVGHFLQWGAAGIQRFKPTLTLLETRLENSGFQDGCCSSPKKLKETERENRAHHFDSASS